MSAATERSEGGRGRKKARTVGRQRKEQKRAEMEKSAPEERESSGKKEREPRKERDFRHETLQDAKAIEQYLSALAEGFRTRSLSFKDNESEITLEPTGLVRLELTASRRRDRAGLTLKFSWKPKSSSKADPGPLQINGTQEADE